jgi:hypothetical protein
VENYGGGANVDDNGDNTITFFRLTDDIDQDGIAGAIIVVDPSTGLLTTVHDFDDLHTFNIAFDQMTLEQGSGLRSFDVGAVYWFFGDESEPADPNRRAVPKTVAVLEGYSRRTGSRPAVTRNINGAFTAPSQAYPSQYTRFATNRKQDGLGFIYGFREAVLWSRFGFEGDGGILGRTETHTNTENWVEGPQAGLVGYKRFGPLSFYAHGLVVAGLNDGEIEQFNEVGEELVPGATNRLLYAQQTHSTHGDSRDEIVPTGVVWAETGLQLTKNSSVKLAWSAIFLENILLAEDRTRFFLPDMGLREPGTQSYFNYTLFCGVEMVR